MLFFIGVAFFVFFGNLNNTNGGYGTKEKSPENRVLGAFYEPLNISNMLFLNPKKVDLLPKLYQKGAFDRIYAQVEQKYGVPRQIIAAIHMVESNQSADNQRVSRAGAVGPMQFMPRTWEAYKQDGNNDGVASIYSVEDALYSAGNMLRANGAARGNLRGAIFNYNHSQAYVERVLALARGMGFAGN